MSTNPLNRYSAAIQQAGLKREGMKRLAALFAIALVGASLPGIADAQAGRGRARTEWAVPEVRPDSLGADWRQQQDEARRGVRQGRMMPLEQVVGRLSRRTPGRLLDTGIETWGGQTVYRVRWQANDGRRIDYIVDAGNGSVISAQGE